MKYYVFYHQGGSGYKWTVNTSPEAFREIPLETLIFTTTVEVDSPAEALELAKERAKERNQ